MEARHKNFKEMEVKMAALVQPGAAPPASHESAQAFHLSGVHALRHSLSKKIGEKAKKKGKKRKSKGGGPTDLMRIIADTVDIENYEYPGKKLTESDEEFEREM